MTSKLPAESDMPMAPKALPRPLKIAVDGMGGDHAPSSVIKGMALALARLPFLSFELFGDQEVLLPLLKRHKALAKVTTLQHTDEKVLASTKPAEALRGLRQSSMRLALDATKSGACDATVSAGNTGAYLALAKFVLKTLQGVTRPAIVSQVPTQKGETVFLDLGGNLTCSARHLVEFALMGRVFARHLLFCEQPKVGLLNVGSEMLKGVESIKEAAKCLEKVLPHYYGFVEGNDITKGTVDVVVADGFAGNVALKASEGAVEFLLQSLKNCFKSSFATKLAYLCARGVLKTLATQLDPRKYNGAFWLGLDGVAVKSHGGADPLAFSYAIEMAADMANSTLKAEIEKEMERLATYDLFSASAQKVS